MMDIGFTFYRSWYEAISLLSKRGRLEIFRAICRFAFEGDGEPSFTDDTAKILWIVIKPQIVVKGGSSSGKESARKPISNKTRFMILERDGFACRYCGATAEQSRLEIDHVIPVSKGGSNDPDNLVTACHECNSGKRAHIIGEPRKWSL